MIRILSIGPDPDILAARSRILAQSGYDVCSAASRADALAAAKLRRFDAVLLCSEFPFGYARQLANELRPLIQRAPLIALSGQNPISVAEIEETIRDNEMGARAA